MLCYNQHWRGWKVAAYLELVNYDFSTSTKERERKRTLLGSCDRVLDECICAGTCKIYHVQHHICYWDERNSGAPMPVVGKGGPVEHIKLSELSMEQVSIPIERELLALEAIEYTHHRKRALRRIHTGFLVSTPGPRACRLACHSQQSRTARNRVPRHTLSSTALRRCGAATTEVVVEATRRARAQREEALTMMR